MTISIFHGFVKRRMDTGRNGFSGENFQLIADGSLSES